VKNFLTSCTKRIDNRLQQEIVEESVQLLKHTLNLTILQKMIEEKFDVYFDDKKQMWEYLRRLFIKHDVRCIHCGKKRYKGPDFSLYCKKCRERIKKEIEHNQSWQSVISANPEEFIIENFWDVYDYHGDIFNYARDRGKLGTTDFKSEPLEDIKNEANAILKEFRRLNLKPSRIGV